MPRRARSIIGGYAYHVLNRANGRLRLFRKEADYLAFETVLAQACQRVPLRILGYTIMPNHWHFVVWPRRGHDDEVSEFFRWLSVTHTLRRQAHRNTIGMGHVYQGRFKSFPIEQDEHVSTVLRYVERNPLRARLVQSADAWRWGSLYLRLHGTPDERAILADCPVPLGTDWLEHVNRPQNEAELAAIRQSLVRGQPYGAAAWQQKTAARMGLEHTFRPRGRPKTVERPSGKPSRPL
jgi:putative transposase